MEREQNLDVGFTAVFDESDVENVALRIASSSICRVFVNEFFAVTVPAEWRPDFSALTSGDWTYNHRRPHSSLSWQAPAVFSAGSTDVSGRGVPGCVVC